MLRKRITALQIAGFNLSILECKSLALFFSESVLMRFNLSILECKSLSRNLASICTMF